MKIEMVKHPTIAELADIDAARTGEIVLARLRHWQHLGIIWAEEIHLADVQILNDHLQSWLEEKGFIKRVQEFDPNLIVMQKGTAYYGTYRIPIFFVDKKGIQRPPVLENNSYGIPVDSQGRIKLAEEEE